MTKLLEMAMQRAAEFPDAEQDRIAQLMLDAIADDARWQATFSGPQDKLARLAQRGRREITRGEVHGDDCVDRQKGSCRSWRGIIAYRRPT